MKRSGKIMIGATALALALSFPAGAGADTNWVCTVDGVPTVFVRAAHAARNGLTQANSRAGTVFEEKFGEENCHIE